ncbi:hypothetical protein HK104_010247 [Borealophlyctis nickersoniae]|nr:hypothetical protein HK104_010247 [Borealophlyctis nickersoniae]
MLEDVLSAKAHIDNRNHYSAKSPSRLLFPGIKEPESPHPAQVSNERVVLVDPVEAGAYSKEGNVHMAMSDQRLCHLLGPPVLRHWTVAERGFREKSFLAMEVRGTLVDDHDPSGKAGYHGLAV